MKNEIDSITFMLYSCELEEKLINSRLQKIFQPGDAQFVFRFRLLGENYFLYVSLEPDKQKIHPVPQKFGQSKEPSSFCMLLRKNIGGGKVLYAGRQGKDRILRLNITSRDELGIPSEKILIIELTGKTSNIILCDHKDYIIGTFHKKDPRRELSKGKLYEAPPLPWGIDPFTVDEQSFLNLMGDEQTLDVSVNEFIGKTFTGLNKELTREILHLTDISPSTMLHHLNGSSRENLWQAFRGIMDRIEQKKISPFIYYAKDDPLMENSPQKWALWNYSSLDHLPKEAVQDLGEALQGIFFQKTASSGFDDVKKELISSLSKKIKKTAGRIKKQEQDLQGAVQGVSLKKWGELILANLQNIPEKSKEITLEDYYEYPPKPVKIKLDPSKSASANAQEYFKRYKKAKRGVEKIQERLEISKEELSDLENTMYELENTESFDDLYEIIDLLQGEGIYAPASASPSGKKLYQEPAGPHKFELGQGYIALAGRNSKQNEHLTLHTAGKEDLWFHARQIPGSHVILRIQKPSKPVPDQYVYKAACIAAYYSKARTSLKVPVDYTQVKNVRKVKGQKAGKVFYVNEKTIMAKPGID